jgi:hypothetical protein
VYTWEILLKNCVEVCGINQYWLLYRIIWFVTQLLLIWMEIIIGEFRLDCVWFCKFWLVFFWQCIIQHTSIWHFTVFNTRCEMFLTDGCCVICMQMEEVFFLLLFTCICFVVFITQVMHPLVNLFGRLVLLFCWLWFWLLLLVTYCLGVKWVSGEELLLQVWQVLSLLLEQLLLVGYGVDLRWITLLWIVFIVFTICFLSCRQLWAWFILLLCINMDLQTLRESKRKLIW